MQTANANNGSERHVAGAELIGILYETSVAGPHVEACAHCQGRLRSMEALRRAGGGLQTLDGHALSAQRASIYARLDSRPASGARWLWAAAPFAAAAALLLMVDPRPAGSPASTKQAAIELVADDTLYSDIYQTLSQEAPAGVYTVAGMFDVAEENNEARKN